MVRELLGKSLQFLKDQETAILQTTQFRFREIQSILEISSPAVAFLDYRVPARIMPYYLMVYTGLKAASWLSLGVLACIPRTTSQEFFKGVIREPMKSVRRLGHQILDRYDPDFQVQLPREMKVSYDFIYDHELGQGKRNISYL